ncbi:MAG: tRNA pseudouridine(55) synthase TruB [Myxococcota bacterium]
MGSRRSNRSVGVDGVLLVDKPSGLTSHDVVGRLRRALRTRTVGHAGTLDPMATGLLVVLVGYYTRLSPYLTGADKAYDAEVTFGKSTTTDDAEGEVLETSETDRVTEAELRAALAGFRGRCVQVPPAYSAIQIAGERMYDKARRGESVEIPAREVTFHELECLGYEPPRASLAVRCSKGTYIRSLARDLGQRMGVPAHLSGLRRTGSGAFRLADAVPLEDLLVADVAQRHLRRGLHALPGLTAVEVEEDLAKELLLGRPVLVPGASPLQDAHETCLAHIAGDVVALVTRLDDGRWRSVRALRDTREAQPHGA